MSRSAEDEDAAFGAALRNNILKEHDWDHINESPMLIQTVRDEQGVPLLAVVGNKDFLLSIAQQHGPLVMNANIAKSLRAVADRISASPQTMMWQALNGQGMPEVPDSPAGIDGT